MIESFSFNEEVPRWLGYSPRMIRNIARSGSYGSLCDLL